MLTRLADLGIRAPRRVLGVAGLLLVLGGIFGSTAADHLSSGGFRDPDAPSTKAEEILQKDFRAGDANLIIEVTSPQGVDDAAARERGMAVVRAVERSPYASQVASYWTAPKAQAATLRSTDGTSALVVARIAGDDSQAPERTAAITEPLTGTRDGVTVIGGGIGNAYQQVNDQTKKDLATSESVAIPITVVVLVWVFGSLVAALLPLAVGLSAIIGTMAILRALAGVTDVSIYALNMTTAMGLALAIDYSLLMVSRYREETGNGAASDEAVRRTMQTAGRTVLFSALTVGLCLAAMLVFPVYFLRSFAYAGIAVVGLATLAALVLLPALLTLLGPRVNSLDLRAGVRRLLRRPSPVAKPLEQTFWYRFATWVMHRALPVAVVVTGVLVVLGIPFLGANFAYPDDRVLPHSAEAHQVGDDLRERFGSNAASTMIVVAPDVGDRADEVAGYADRLSRLENVTAVSSAAGTYADGAAVSPADPSMAKDDATYLVVHTDTDPQSGAAKNLLSRVEDTPAPWPTLVGGQTADNKDSLDALAGALPYALVWIAVALFTVLFLFTGSVVLPLKALVLNTLSLSATFGAMVWIFQDGHLAGLYPDLTTTGYLVPTMPLLMFCVAFGLSMDYEVFLLSRIREAWLASGRTSADNARAVATGLGRTGRIVTAAALLMAIVFASIATSGISFMMLFGTGLTLAVLMDATVVRGTLVPAFMRLASTWNWWAPAPLARLHQRIGLSDEPAGDRDPAPTGAH
ncbi:MAG TPA: MMPL family transporter [Nocardioides sp.]|nr:MMPL family transporter [Nocardioides sp.]